MVKVERKSVMTQKEEAIAALLRAPRVEAAAAMIGVDEALLRQWLEEPRFRARYEAARQVAVDDSLARLQQLATTAVEALARNLTCGIPEVEVDAAKVILAHTVTGANRPGQDDSGSRNGHAPRHSERR
jgi:hypothetical protein